VEKSAAPPTPPALPTGTVTFLFTDLEGSTRLLQAHPGAYREAVARHHALLRGAVEAHGGVVFETVGDAVYAAFARPTDAVAAALAGQLALRREAWGATGEFRVRMGVHLGEVEAYPAPGAAQGARYFGQPLVRCARLTATAHGGQVVLSEAVTAVVRDALPDAAALRDLGEHRLRDLARPEHVYQLVHPELLHDFPPLRALDALANNLPLQLTSFVGRARELAAVGEALAAHRLLTLTGPGGTGKTRLALQLAAHVAGEYPDGAWLAELAPLADSALVPQTVAVAVGVREEPGRPLAATLADALRTKRLLLVLDNCEHLLPAVAPLAADLLAACPGLMVLATSRAPLRVRGEHRFPVPPLTLPDPARLPDLGQLTQYEAVALFVARAAGVRPDFVVTNANAPAVAELCHRLDGLPLALELAAARAALLPPAALLARLERRLPLLRGGPRDAPARHQTLRATLDWSHDLLDAAERALFRRLAVFAGGCTLEAAEAVCGAPDGGEDPPLDVLEGLASLVEKSLVRQDADPGGEARFGMLETIREYGLERLDESNEGAARRRRHTSFFLELARAAEPSLLGPEQPAWLDRLDAEHDNFRAALARTQPPAGAPADAAALDTGLRLAGALLWFWYLRGHVSEGRGWLHALLARTEASGASPARAQALFGAGWLAVVQGEYAVARRLLDQSAGLWRDLGDARGHGRALTALAIADHFLGDMARSDALLVQGAGLFREAGDRWGLAQARRQLAVNARERGDLENAALLGEESVTLSREAGDRYSLGVSLAGLGVVHSIRGDDVRAGALFTEALRTLRGIQERWWSARCVTRLARIACTRDQHVRAALLAGSAEAMLEALGSRLHRAERDGLDRVVTLSRAALGGDAFAAAWAEGRAMTPEQAVAYALDEADA
jgi:predicted ATPase